MRNKTHGLVTLAKQTLVLIASIAILQSFSAVKAQADSTSADNGSFNQGKYELLNNDWGYLYNGWGSGYDTITADPYGTPGQWSVYFDWSNNPNVAYDEYHIKTYPCIIDGWQYGYENSGSDFPFQIWNNWSIPLQWDFSIAPDDWSNYKADISWDIWLDPSTNPSGGAAQEIMIWPWYTGAPEDEGLTGYVTDTTIDNMTWHIYRNSSSVPYTIWFVAASPTTSVNLDLQDFLSYCEWGPGWIDHSLNLLSVEAGTEVWYGSGTLTTNSYSVSVNQ